MNKHFTEILDVDLILDTHVTAQESDNPMHVSDSYEDDSHYLCDGLYLSCGEDHF